MKRVLLIMDFKPRLRRTLELWFIALASSLRERGVEFHIMVSGDGPDWFVQEFEASGGRIITEPKMRGRFDAPSAEKAMQQVQPDAVVFLFYPMLALPVLKIARYKSVKAALFLDHSSIPLALRTGLKGLLVRLRGKILGRVYQTVVTVSDFKRQRLMERLGIPATRIRRIYNGVDMKRFDKPPATIKPDAPLLYVGQIEDYKGIPTLLAAYELLRKRVPHAPVLQLAGAGSLREPLEQKMKDRGLTDSVQFLGLRNDAAELMMSARANLIPSEWDEACAMVALESMAAGRPVIAANAGSLAELLGEHGVIHPPKDVQALAAAMERVLDPAHADEYAKRGAGLRERAASQFTFDRMIREYTETYCRACGMESGF